MAAVLNIRPRLTHQEARVLELVAEGLTTREMATRLVVTPKDVEYHVGNLILKFGADNRTGVISRAYVLGFLAMSWPPTCGQRACDGGS